MSLYFQITGFKKKKTYYMLRTDISKETKKVLKFKKIIGHVRLLNLLI